VTTTPITTSTSTPSTLSGVKTSKAAEKTGELGQDAFLKLLVAQLKYQDPLNPADGAEFIAQTAQFTMVEKLTAMVTQGDKMALSQQATQAAQLVGKQVTYLTDSGVSAQGIVESTKFSSDGQSLTINGKSVQLSAVTGVLGSPENAQLTAALANLGPSLSASLAPELAKMLRELGVNSSVPASTGTTTGSSVATGASAATQSIGGSPLST
jgi:flagellar basal-body rod modification protein FlgD